jgi:hypothetical protein
MRLFLALGLTLVVGLGAAFRPSDNSPGREVGATESSQVIGGANCGNFSYTTCRVSGQMWVNCCLPGSTPGSGFCSACSANSTIWGCFVAGGCSM